MKIFFALFPLAVFCHRFLPEFVHWFCHGADHVGPPLVFFCMTSVPPSCPRDTSCAVPILFFRALFLKPSRRRYARIIRSGVAEVNFIFFAARA
jgi:hypothetical protein